MLCQGQPQVVISLAAALIIVWSVRLLFVHDGISTLLYQFDDSTGQQVESAFVRQAMDVEFPEPIDYRPIQSVCAATQFRPGLVFSCEGQHGGIGMVRDQILKCVRYAIHGGGAIVVPSMQLRNAKDISDIETEKLVPLDYLLDRQTFITHLTEGCPGMRVYERVEDFPHYDQRAGEPLELVGDQFEPNHPREGLEHPREWRRFFDEWLHKQSVKIRTDAPVHVKIGQAFLEYPVRDDGPAFVHEYGKILSFRNDTRELAAKILYQLKKRFALPIDPARAINPGAYFGAHLRLEKDAIDAWQPDEWRFSRMKDQFEEQFRYIERMGLDVVYVASGNQTVVELFDKALRKRSAANPKAAGNRRVVSVVTKRDLLQGPDRKLLDDLTFDQHALIDFLMLFKASAFMGVAHSSFPWTVALRRHEMSKYTTYGNEGSDILRDEYSVIMGMQKDYPEVEPFVYGLWP